MTLLERLRCDRGLTQREVETGSGVNHKTLVKYELAVTDKIQYDTLRKLADYYGIPASDILTDIRRAIHERESLADAA